MLNLYLTPRGLKAPVPTEDKIEKAVQFLQQAGIIGSRQDNAWIPGPTAAQMFNQEAHDDLLPAELTFDSLEICESSRPQLLPQHHGEGFRDTLCGICGDEIGVEILEPELARLKYFPVSRFDLRCPSCGSELSFKQLDFELPVALAKFWIFIEGAGTSRLDHRLVDRLSKILGMLLTIIPEVPAEDVTDWVPARRRGRG